MADSTSTTPVPMEGHGVYARSSRVQATGLSPAVPLFEQAARGVLLAPQGPIVIADYGASVGTNSLGPIAVAIKTLRERAEQNRPIWVFHTDLPSNDFVALFQTLVTDPVSYICGDTAVFPAAIGRSFYQQVLPADSVTLAWSSWAVQWLSRAPTQIPDHVQVAYSHDSAARAAFAEQAAADWRTFLLHRASELRPGGRLVILAMAVDDTGDFGYQPLLDSLYGTLEQMVHEHFISADELLRMNIPTVARNRKDFTAPFSENGRFARLSMEEIEVFHGEDQVWAQFERTGDSEAFGAQWAAFSRASVFPTLATGLRGSGADPRAHQFVDSLERRVAQQLAAAPQKFAIPLARMLIAKDA